MQRKVGIIGVGNIGKSLHEQLFNMGWPIAFSANRKFVFGSKKESIENLGKYASQVGLVFLAIPTIDDGFSAFDYISTFVGAGIPVVTCEKGALANYFLDLKPRLPLVGYSATVGGGSGMVHFLRQRFSGRVQEVHAILNGTLNHIFCDIAGGESLENAVTSVKCLHYTEPGESDAVKIVMAEALADATKKAAILFNTCFKSIFVCARDIKALLTLETTQKALDEANSRRFVVSFVKRSNFRKNPNDILAFCYCAGNWVIQGAFVEPINYPIAELCSSATFVNNGLLALEQSGAYRCVGPGAGLLATTSAMIQDAEQLFSEAQG